MILLLRRDFKVRDGTWPVLVRKNGLKFLPEGSPALSATKKKKKKETFMLPGAQAQFRLPIQELKTFRIVFMLCKFASDF